MKKLIYATIISILIHLLLFVNLDILNIEKKQESSKENQPKYNIDYVKIKSSQLKDQADTSKLKLAEKDVATKDNQKALKKQEAKNVKKEEIKTPQLAKQDPNGLKEKIKNDAKKYHQAFENNKNIIKQKSENSVNSAKASATKPQDDSLQSFLSTPVQGEVQDELTRSYLALYGDEYKKFTNVQKSYLKEHLRDIGRITQMYLYYPEVAAKTRQFGMNIVEFYLHPNGDITELKLLQTAGYELLDKNSIQTIEVAYKDYPKPSEKTLIRIYVHYKLY